MEAYQFKNRSLDNPSKNLTHSVKRLYRRTSKVDAAVFYVRKHADENHTRRQLTDHALDEWLTQTFSRLYEKNRFDSKMFATKEALICEGSRWGISTKKKFYALDLLLKNAQISESQLSLKEIWIFALYQTLRYVEHKLHSGQHLYTSPSGRDNSERVIHKLDRLIPGWLDSSGKISRLKQYSVTGIY